MQWVTTDLHAKIPRYIYQANKVIRKTISKPDFREKNKTKEGDIPRPEAKLVRK